MIEITPNSFLTKPYPYQKDGLLHIFNRLHKEKRPPGSEGNAALFDEMGVGKTKQTIDAASIYFENGKIDTVIVVCPASVRGTWDNAETGEIAKHCKSDYVSFRYDKKFPEFIVDKNVAKTPNFIKQNNQLLWITISYSFLRARRQEFIQLVKKYKWNFLLVLDESSFVKSHKAQQTKACKELREYANYCILLNGTPIANNTLDLWSQFNILDPVALGNIGFYHFRARYCLMGGFEGREVLNLIEEKKKVLERIRKPKNEQDLIWANQKLEDILRVEESIERLKTKLKPWVIRREKKDVLLDLPPKLPPVYLEAPLSTEGYRVYKEMAEDMVAWANSENYSMAVNGAVKSGRLTQITSGFVGGLAAILEEDEEHIERQEITDISFNAIKEIDDSKLKAFLEWYEINKHLKVLVWCYFRAEIFRLRDKLEELGYKVGVLIGGQSGKERDEIKEKATKGEYDIVIGQISLGFGIDGLQNHIYTCVYMSFRHHLIHFQQSSDRLHRNGQTMPVSYIFILATTPTGKKTIDHLTLRAVLNKEDMASWTLDKWREEVKNL